MSYHSTAYDIWGMPETLPLHVVDSRGGVKLPLTAEQEVAMRLTAAVLTSPNFVIEVPPDEVADRVTEVYRGVLGKVTEVHRGPLNGQRKTIPVRTRPRTY